MESAALRTRWAAIGAAVAVSLGAGGVSLTQATTSSGERAIYVPLDQPCRLADNRPDGIGPETSVTFAGWGTVGECELPEGTSGLALNVTAVDATDQTNLRFYAADASLPATANLNPTPDSPPIPNSVNVALSDAGEFKVFNKFGTVAVIIDVMGLYDDHDHDDRYYQKTETYTQGEVDTELGLKADVADVYTRAEVDAAVGDSGGVDFASGSGSGGIPTALATYATMTISAPADGFIVVNGTVRVSIPTGESATCLLALDSVPQVSAALSTEGFSTYANTFGAAVTAGDHTVELQCSASSAGVISLFAPQVTATFSTNRL